MGSGHIFRTLVFCFQSAPRVEKHRLRTRWSHCTWPTSNDILLSMRSPPEWSHTPRQHPLPLTSIPGLRVVLNKTNSANVWESFSHPLPMLQEIPDKLQIVLHYVCILLFSTNILHTEESDSRPFRLQCFSWWYKRVHTETETIFQIGRGGGREGNQGKEEERRQRGRKRRERLEALYALFVLG